MSMKKWSVGFLAPLVMAASSHAATIYYSTSATAPVVGVPTVSLAAAPGATVTGLLYAFIDIKPATDGFAGIALNTSYTQTGTGTLTATGVTLDNTNPGGAARWDTTTSSINKTAALLATTLQDAVGSTGINQQTLEAGLGIGASTPDATIASSSTIGGQEYELYQLNYSIVAPTTGTATYDLSFAVGSGGIASDGSSTQTFGTPSGSAIDAILTVGVPEPTSAALLGVGVVAGFVRRRRAF